MTQPIKPRPTISDNGDREREFLAIWDRENLAQYFSTPISECPYSQHFREALSAFMCAQTRNGRALVEGDAAECAVMATSDAFVIARLLDARAAFIQKLADVHAGDPLVVDGDAWAIVGGPKP